MEVDEIMSSQERQLCHFLGGLPAMHKYRYTDQASRELLESLFWSMAGGNKEYLRLFFPDRGGPDRPNGTLNLREAQGAVEGAEYTEAARGTACGHIFRAGEATYSCRTCSTDDTCVLCTRCFDSTDHSGHMVRISVSPGNSGCCDCGDPEAWRLPMFCTIHSQFDTADRPKGKGKAVALPQDLVDSITMTIGRAFDYLCDVIYCCPEQLRAPKTVESILFDERASRLSSTYGNQDDEDPERYAVLIWNDEKHTHHDVRDHVARACHVPLAEAMARANETDIIGRSIIFYSSSIQELLEIANIIEQIKLTVTIRSSRDLFREQMCATIIEWLCDIAGCTVGHDAEILRRVVCEEMLKPWRQDNPATHALLTEPVLYDHEHEDREWEKLWSESRLAERIEAARLAEQNNVEDDEDDDENEDDEDVDILNIDGDDEDEDDGNRGDVDEDDEEEDVIMVDARELPEAPDANAAGWRQGNPSRGVEGSLEEDEATMADYPPPPPPPPTRRRARDREVTPSDSDTAEPLIAPSIYVKNNLEIPKTPGLNQDTKTSPPKPGTYWLGVPPAYLERENLPVSEDLFRRVRLDWMVMFDLRLWKKVRNDLRALYISTVVTIPEFKRVLGLRFAGLYTTLAQLYLIGDREPDHSIINISLQMLTTPSITAEIVERGNFLTTLMAILYTFLTTRQVGHPLDVSSNAVLAFDAGSITNRRMYHFFTDLKYLFGSQHVQERLRTEERYTMQFLDLIKLHQGICPNTRAVGEHVEYETDTWINASLITREINTLCRQFSESFRNLQDKDFLYLTRAIRLVAKSVILNSIGAERARFTQAEIKDEVRFKSLGDFEFDEVPAKYDVVKFVIEEQPISFHHSLHYTLSWLIECGKSMPREQLRALLTFTAQELKAKPKSMGRKLMPRRELQPEDYLMAAFDYPLRVCAWLSQMKAGMWVRNGMSLRHQAGTYRGVKDRDVSHHRDVFLLQTAMVMCDPSRVLASIVDRFGMDVWIKGFFEQKSAAQDDSQHLDVVEDMIHLLIVMLSDRTSLLPTEVEPNAHLLAIRRDITHVLCFKPLSYSEITVKMPTKYQDNEDFPLVLKEIATYKGPEGMTDVGAFELKPDYAGDIDPFIAHYSKNQREEAENAYKKAMSTKTGRPAEEIVFEPKLRPIPSGVFASLSDFTRTGMFGQIVYHSLLYPMVAKKLTPAVKASRVETFLQVVLHIILLAISEDNISEDSDEPSFINLALNKVARSNFMANHPGAKTIVSLLNLISTEEDFKSSHQKTALILKRMRQKRPQSFESACLRQGMAIDRINTASPANAVNAEEERERKKRAAKERQARVMAQFQQQQKSFMANQGGANFDYDEDEDLEPQQAEEQKNFWKYPGGTCILCQEDMDERRLFGTFAFISESKILRQTDLQDPDFVREALNTPRNLDRSAESIRPFGVAHENRHMVTKMNAAGEVFTAERQVIGKGFPANNCKAGPVSVGCGHVMHWGCFEMYFMSTLNRHHHQIARQHPENIHKLEFVCPLCKALGNAFLPIIWKGKEESYPGVLNASYDFTSFLQDHLRNPYYAINTTMSRDPVVNSFMNYTQGNIIKELADRSAELVVDAWELPEKEPAPAQRATPAARIASLFPRHTLGLDTPRRRDYFPDSKGDPLKELVLVYRRIMKTLKANGIPSHMPYERDPEAKQEEMGRSDVLAQAVGFSISAAEIQQRGTDAEYGVTFVGKIPESVLTHLRILAETVDSYIAVGGQRHGGDNHVARDYRVAVERQHCQLFMASYASTETDLSRSPMRDYEPLLSMDPFVFLCECVFGVMRAQGIDTANLVRLCYLAEITKVVYHMGRNMPTHAWIPPLLEAQANEQDPSMRAFAMFCLGVVEQDMLTRTRASGAEGSVVPDVSILDAQDSSLGQNRGFDQPGFTSGPRLAGHYTFVRRYALAFLRKCAVLLYVKFGVDLQNHVSPSPELEELDRLTEALRVPTFDEMLASLAADEATRRLVGGWIQHELSYPRPGQAENKRKSKYEVPLSSSAMVSHPGIFELVGLPMNFDSLIDECTRRRCPTTGRDVADPALCLMCGAVLCSQASCCLVTVRERARDGGQVKESNIGGCQQHRRVCNGNVGLFLNIRKCALFLVHQKVGTWAHAPYVDKYGEMDIGLRHGRQLFLNQRRYDMILRNLWLGHGIPSYISRRLESDVNNGGWETI